MKMIKTLLKKQTQKINNFPYVPGEEFSYSGYVSEKKISFSHALEVNSLIALFFWDTEINRPNYF